MTKINVMSDLHLWFEDIELPGGEVLILAGDIMEAEVLTRSSTYPKKSAKYQRFLNDELPKYNKVFYVMGNHEHYDYDMAKTWDTIHAALPTNTSLLEQGYMEYGGVAYFGGTMWTTFDNRSMSAERIADRSMNDFHSIRLEGARFTTSDAADDCEQFTRVLQDFLAKSTCEKKIIITHHAPSRRSVDNKYAHEWLLNYAYYEDQELLIKENPSIKYWIHGHMHSTSDYMIDGTRVIANPRGYVQHGHRENLDFNVNLTIEV